MEALALADATELRGLPGSIADLILAADRLADDVQTRLVAAVSRRRPFADHAAAMNFVAAELYRADRQLWARPAPMTPPGLYGHCAGPGAYH